MFPLNLYFFNRWQYNAFNVSKQCSFLLSDFPDILFISWTILLESEMDSIFIKNPIIFKEQGHLELSNQV